MPLFTSEYVFSDDYPTIEPSLKLDFANARALDPRITFTRASTATYVGANGLIKTAGVDEARFDHDPETLESLGLLIEESRTNLFKNSSVPCNDGRTVTDVVNGIDLYTITANVNSSAYNSATGSGNSGFMPVQQGVEYVVSFYAKRVDTNTVTCRLVNSTGGLLTGTGYVDPTSDGGRVSVKLTCTVSGSAQLFLGMSPGLSVEFGGLQVEAGSFPTSYIPTSGSAVTRVADAGNITGDAFSSFYNTTEGVLQTEFSRIGSVNNQMVVQLKDSDGSERIEIRGQASSDDSFRMEVIEGDATNNQEYAFSGSVVANVVGQFAKVNLAYKQNDFASTINGTIASTDNAGDVGVCDRVGIGYANYGIGYNGHIKNIIYYPKRLTNAQLQLLTS